MKKALVIFNPNAGLSSKLDVEKNVRDKLAGLGYDVDLIYLNAEFEDSVAAEDFSEIRLVVAVGGDGTVKVAGRTIVANHLDAPLSIVPFGSANVIASSLNIPINIKAALNLLENEKFKKIDMGLINKNHYFLVGFSVGYISRIVSGTTVKLKNKYGFLGYVINFIFNNIRIKRIKFKIKTQNRTFWIKGNSLIVFNAFNFYGFKPKKPVLPDDGILNLYVITNKNFWTMLLTGWQVLIYHQPRQYLFSLDNKYFKIHLKNQLRSCQIDGDFIRLPKDLEIEILPQALKIITA